MREKKYANILDDYPEEIVDDIKEEIEVLEEIEEDDNEVKLSMTRELKFKELHESVEDDVIVDENASDISLNEIKNDESVINEEKITEDNTVSEPVNIEKINEEDEFDLLDKKKKKKKEKINDELYLTSSFKPFRKRIGLGKVFKILFILILFGGAIAALTFFLIIPIYKKFVLSTPKAIFDTSITYIGEQLKTLNDYYSIDTDVLDLETVIGIDMDNEDGSSFMNNKIGFRLAYDPKSDKSETMYFLQNDNGEKYGYSHISDGDNLYYKFSTSETYLKSDEAEYQIDYSAFNKILEKDLTKKDFTYYVDSNVKLLKDIITEDMLVSERDEIEIDGNGLAVVKNSLKLDKENLELIEKKYNEGILDDDKLLKIEALLFDMTLDEVKDNHGETTNYEKDYSMTINIYTVKGNKFVGFDVEINGFRTIYYYVNENGNFEAHFNVSLDEECLTGGDCLLKNQIIIDMVGTKKDDFDEVEIYLNDEDIGTLKVREFGYELIDFDYRVIVSDVVLEGTIKLDFDKKENEMNIDFSYEFNEQYSSFDVMIKLYDDSDIGNVNQEKVVLYTDKLYEEEFELFTNQLSEKNMLEDFDILLSMFGESDETEDNAEIFDLESFEIFA